MRFPLRAIIAAIAIILPGHTSPVELAKNDRVLFKGNVHPKARAEYDRGPADPSIEIGYAMLILKPSAEQQAALDALLVEQQDPSSANYHKWLTPEQFADRFGLSRGNIAKITGWLESQGLKVNDVARGRRWITFTGTAAHISAAFQTEIHRYQADGAMHFANATEPSVPAKFANLVSWVEGLNDFPATSYMTEASLSPDYNVGSKHWLAPDDFATIYDITPLYNAGIDGTGQKIAVPGAANLNLADIRSFRKQFNLPANDPQIVPYGTGPGGEALGEADLDVEWSGAVARGATILYVYSNNVNNSFQYAVDQDLAQVISSSYGACEPETSPANRAGAQQANAEGITWVVASGDSGPATCDPHGSTSNTEATHGVAASFPASIPEVTAVGGTQIDDSTGNYWAPANNANGESALSYIPEEVWNGTGPQGLLAGGGAPSIFFTKPAWQTGPGVPNDNARDVPDVALNATARYASISGGAMHYVGGTSAATPSFAGIVALLNQYQAAHGGQAGLGNINPNLYRLAQTAPSVFHDITAGSNIVPCEQSSLDCSTGSLGYNAAPGYDLATGLGSVDVNSLANQWNSAATSTTLTLAAVPNSFLLNGSTQLTATVTAAGGATPGGTVNFSSGGTFLGSAALSGAGASASAVLTLYGAQLATGNNTILAIYGGGDGFDGSSASAAVSVAMPTGASAVVPSVTPNPIYQDANANTWTYKVTLTEMAGVATTLTDFTINGVSDAQQIASQFGSAAIPAKGSISASIVSSNLTPPGTLLLGFSGVDASGQQWSAQLPVSYYGQQIAASAKAALTPGTVLENPNAVPSCQWAQQVGIEDIGGTGWQITGLTAGSNSLTSQISQIFGTTRLGPLAGIQGTICWSGITAPQSSTLTINLTNTGTGGGAKMSAGTQFRAAAASPATLSASPAQIPLTAANPSGSVAVALSDPTQTWSVSVFPNNRSTSWLTVSPASGTGPGQIALTASASGLNVGAYRATLVIQSINATPQFVDVPVSFVVGASSTTSIGGVANGASFQTSFAPGMILSAFGAELAPGTQVAASLPLPLSMAGVSATVNGIAAPLYYVSPGQLNIQVPYETGAGAAVLGVNNNGQIASYTFQVAPSAPGIFTDQNLNLVPYSSGTQGLELPLFITGEGDVTPALATATTPAASTALANLPKPILPVAVTVGGVPATLQFVGITNGLAGVTQVNFAIPQGVPPGVQPVVVTVGGVPSAAANLNITQ
jgi:uncharacterized protein (TIGR03437 family)